MKKLIYSQEDVDLMLSLEIEEKEEQITQLTNNWNELEEWLKNHYEVKNKTQNECIDKVLDKMKEIKEGNNESK